MRLKDRLKFEVQFQLTKRVKRQQCFAQKCSKLNEITIPHYIQLTLKQRYANDRRRLAKKPMVLTESIKVKSSSNLRIDKELCS